MRTYIGIAASFVATLAASTPAISADLLACADRDIADALLRSASAGSPTISDEWSPRVPRIALPPEFDTIGSSTRSFTAFVALKTSLPPTAARQRLDAALTAAGWQDRARGSCVPPEAIPTQQPGFHLRQQFAVQCPARYCRDGAGPLTVNVTDAPRQKGSYVTLVTYRKSTPSCDDLARVERRQTRPNLMPSLALPDGVAVLANHQSSSGGAITSETTTSRIRSGMAGSAVLDHIEQQLTSQQWRRTARWITDGFSGSSWEAANQSASGVLTVIATDDQQYNLRFKVVHHR